MTGDNHLWYDMCAKPEKAKRKHNPENTTMPNQRKKGKAFIGGYVPKELADAFKAAAESQGTSVKDLLEALIRDELKKGGSNAK